MAKVRPIDIMLASRTKTLEYEDEKGKYKICTDCQGKMYFNELLEQTKNKFMFIKQWEIKKYCTACRDKRNNAHSTEFDKWRHSKYGKPRECKMCGKQFVYMEGMVYNYCSNACRKEGDAIELLARKMGIEEGALKQYLLDYFEDEEAK